MRRAAALLLAALVACPQVSPTAAPRARWAAQGLSSYAYTLRRSCFCPQEIAKAMTVEVRSGAASSVSYADTGAAVPDAFRPKQTRIEDYFDLIETTLAKGGTAKTEFDASRGHPTSILADPFPNAVDDETLYTISDLKPLP